MASAVIAGGRQAARGDLDRQALRRARDLLPRAVIEGDHQRELVVVGRQLLGLFEQRADIRREIVALADHAHMHAVLVAARQDRCG